VQIGEITGVYGVHGWVRVRSYTKPVERILDYGPWHLRHGGCVEVQPVAEGGLRGKGLIARLAGIGDRDEAARLTGAEILAERSRFAAPEPGTFYWADLVGLRVRTTDGQALGIVDHLLETGANDVLVVTGDRRRLIPFVVDDVVQSVDLEGSLIVVDWDPSF